MEIEFELWSKLYQDKKLFPQPNLELKFWPDNLITGKNQLKRGFIDTKYIPNRNNFQTTQKINASLFYIKKYLDDIHSIKIKEGSARIYNTEVSFIRCLKYNTETCINSV